MLVDIDQPVTSPPDAREPGARPCDRRRLDDLFGRSAPSIKPPCRRAWIEAPHPAKVFFEVVEHVDERVAYLSRCPKHARVVSITPHAATTAEDSIHGLRYPDREPAHPALEPRRRVRLYYQVQMIRLNAELKDPEP